MRGGTYLIWDQKLYVLSAPMPESIPVRVYGGLGKQKSLRPTHCKLPVNLNVKPAMWTTALP